MPAHNPQGNAYPVRCRYKGTDAFRQEPKVTDVVIEGFDVRTGRTTWSVPAGPAGILYGGDHPSGALAKVGTTSVLIAVPGRPSMVVDVATGRIRPPAAGEVFACERNVRWTSPETWYAGDGVKVHDWDGGSLTFTCDGSGKATSGQPSWDAAAAVGSTAGKLAFIATADHVVALQR